jgi:hypothetical protein
MVRVVSADPVIFSTLGIGDSYNVNGAFTIGSHFNIRQGQLFKPTADGRLSGLDLGLVLFEGADVVTAQLRANVDNQPGTVIETFMFSGIPEGGLGHSALLSAPSLINPLLRRDTSYWMFLAPGDPSTNAGWNFANSSLTALQYVVIGDEPPRTEIAGLAAFRLSGEQSAPVPEPATLLLVASAVGAAFLRGRLSARSAGVVPRD